MYRRHAPERRASEREILSPGRATGAARQRRRPPPRGLVLALALAVAAAGCDDVEVGAPVTGPDGPDVSQARTDRGASKGRVGRFSLTARVKGPLKPGRPIHVFARARARIPTGRSRVSITLPEVALAKRTGWGRAYRAATGEEIPPAATRTASLSRGARAPVRATFRVEAPGYYRVAATAVPASDEPPVVDGALVQDIGYTELWLWITEDGGKVTESFDASLFPDSIVAQPGPFQLQPRRPDPGALGGQRAVSGDAPAALAATADRVPVEVNYLEVLEDQTEVVRPLRGAAATVIYSYTDQWGQFVTRQQRTSTGGDGRVYLDCSVLDDTSPWAPFAEYSIAVFLQNGLVKVGGPTTLSGGGDLVGACNGTQPPRPVTGESKTSHVFSNLTRYIPEVRDLFGFSRSELQVVLDPNIPTSRYDPPNDVLRIATNPDGRNQIWGEFGRFVHVHEYGHAVHHTALGGVDREACPEDRDAVDQATNMLCAFQEGFASAVSALTTGARQDVFEDHIQFGLYPAPEGTSPSKINDGALIEGAVAAFLVDVVDPPEPDAEWDDLSYPGSYVGDLMKSCQVSGGNPSGRPKGIDHLVWCMEDAVDPDITLSSTRPYFYNRSSHPTSQTNSAAKPADWNPVEVRDAWTRDMYALPRQGGGPVGPEGDDCPPKATPEQCAE